jgi:LysM domain
VRVVLVLVPLALLTLLLTGVFGGNDPEDAGSSSASRDDPTAHGMLRIEVGGDPIEEERVNDEPRPRPVPVPIPDPIPEPDPPTPPRTHIVESGDTLEGLAREYYGDPARWEDIKRANNLRTDVIQLGQKLTIPD